MTLPTPLQITSLYLYGQETKISDAGWNEAV